MAYENFDDEMQGISIHLTFILLNGLICLHGVLD